ncbi:MAG: beta-propeller domain-containing protein [Desulfurococcaceae archaeon]
MNTVSKSMVLLILASLILGILVVTLPSMVQIPGQQMVTETSITTTPEPIRPVDTSSLISVTTITSAPQGNDYARVLKALNDSLRLLVKTGTLTTAIPGAGTTVVAPAVAVVPRSESYVLTEYSSTNIQVRGVDEQDVVKTDGRYIYILRESEIVIFDPLSMNVIGKFKIPEESGYPYVGKGLYVFNEKLVVLASRSYPVTILPIRAYYFQAIGETLIMVIDISNISNPVIVNKIIMDGDLSGSRLVNNYLYAVTTMPCFRIEGGKYVPLIPRINGEYIPASNIVISEEPALHYVVLLSLDISSGAMNSTAILQNTVDWIYMTSRKLYLVSKTDNYLSMNIYDKYKEIFVNTTIALNALPREIYSNISRLVNENNYEEAFAIIESYLQTLDKEKAVELVEAVNSAMPTYSSYTVFTVIEVNGTVNSFKGFVKVEGNVLDQFAMEELENGEYFITATTTTLFKPVFKVFFEEISVAMPSPVQIARKGQIEVVVCENDVCTTKAIAVNITTTQVKELYNAVAKPRIAMYVETVKTDNHVYVIDTYNLGVIGHLRGIAENERIYAARLIKNVFYLVTFRNVDPLFAIDISDPRFPRIIGYLKIPGFSEYLHPVSDDLLLGVGAEDQYLKISLFDVENPLNIVETSSIRILGWSIVLGDHHAFIYDRRYDVVYLPATLIDSISRELISGVLALKVDLAEKRLYISNILDHESAIRVVYIDDRVYTISTRLVKAWSIPGHDYIGGTYLD